MNIKYTASLGLLLLLLLCTNTFLSTFAQEGDGCNSGQELLPTSTQTLQVAGVTRHYDLNIPQTYGTRRPRPTALVMSFHGAGSSPEWNTLIAGWPFFAQDKGFITVVPEAIDHVWDNDLGVGQGIDDVAFVEAMLDDVMSLVCVDQNRIYAAGYSNGGGFVQHLICALPGRFAAAGIVSIRYHEDAINCDSGEATPVILFHGTEDIIAQFEGGTYQAPNLPAQEFLPVEDAAALWAALNGCDAEPTIEQVSDHVQSTHYSGCDNNADVSLYVVEGGGHTWPGSAVDLGRLMVVAGETTQEINATSLMWEFFKEHAKSE